MSSVLTIGDLEASLVRAMAYYADGEERACEDQQEIVRGAFTELATLRQWQSVALPLLRSLAVLDLVPTTDENFGCPFHCGCEDVTYPSFPHEHAPSCAIVIARMIIDHADHPHSR